MSTGNSLSARQVYGFQWVCSAWGMAGSTDYTANVTSAALAASGKRVPKTKLDDTKLLEFIRAELAASLFNGD